MAFSIGSFKRMLSLIKECLVEKFDGYYLEQSPEFVSSEHDPTK